METKKISAQSAHEDIFGMYLRELEGIEPCTEEENRKLLAEIQAERPDARNRLVEGNLKQVLYYVQDYMNRGVPLADLIQEANMELMLLADEAFDGGFEKLLESRVRVRMEEVIEEQKAERGAAKEILSRVNRLNAVTGQMAEELGREATLPELAERMQMTEAEVREIMKTAMDALELSQIHQGFQGMTAEKFPQ